MEKYSFKKVIKRVNRHLEEVRDKYLELLNLDLRLDFDSMTPAQQLENYGTNDFSVINVCN